ncbi:hypothetical protein ACLOJK_031496, partial [Asimina triloba]
MASPVNLWYVGGAIVGGPFSLPNKQAIVWTCPLCFVLVDAVCILAVKQATFVGCATYVCLPCKLLLEEEEEREVASAVKGIGDSRDFFLGDLPIVRVMAEEEPHTGTELKDEVAELAPFDRTKKKKKKKVVIQEPMDDAVDKLTEKTEDLSVAEGIEQPTFVGMKKKKKKPVETDFLNEENKDPGDDLDDDHIGEDEEGEGIVLLSRYPWEGTDRDYKYEELLDRVFNILRENNPELAGDRRRTVIRPPQVLREGTKKTVFVNFMDLCKTMHRQPEHVMTFLLAELGTSGSLDGQQRLVVKGRFAPKNFEGILRRYINEYVICNGCKSPDTILSKENRLFFLRCEQDLYNEINVSGNGLIINRKNLKFLVFCLLVPSVVAR